MIRWFGMPELWNEYWSGQDFVYAAVLLELSLLLDFSPSAGSYGNTAKLRYLSPKKTMVVTDCLTSKFYFCKGAG